MRAPWFALLTVLIVSVSRAQTPRPAFPLDGFFRPGKCMPVQVDATSQSVQLNTAVPTEIAAGRAGVVPVLVLPGDQPIGDAPLRPLSDDERLVATMTDDSSVAQQLFPGQRVVSIRLDPAQPLPGPAIAWESLDGMILDRAMDETKLAEVLAQGTIVAARMEPKPDDRWPWRRVGDCWVVDPHLLGPLGSIGGDVVYLPAAAWQPGQPANLRRQALLAAVVVSLLVMSTLLIRSKWSIIAMLAVTLICAGTIAFWRGAQPPLRSAGGEIVVDRPGIVQHDAWQYVAAGGKKRAVTVTDRPILVDADQASRISLKLACGVDGSVTWQYKLPRGNRLALLARRIEPEKAPIAAASKNQQSPLYELARQAYQTNDVHIAGQTSLPTRVDVQERWSDVVLNGR